MFLPLMRGQFMWRDRLLTAVFCLAFVVTPAAGQGTWSLTVGAGLARMSDQLDGPTLGGPAGRVRVLRENRLGWGLEASMLSFGRSAAAAVCLPPDCVQTSYRGSLESTLFELAPALRIGTGNGAPYLVVTAGYASLRETRQDGVDEAERSERYAGLSGSLGVGLLPIPVGARSRLGLEGRVHGLVAAGSGGVGGGSYFTLVGALRVNFGRP